MRRLARVLALTLPLCAGAALAQGFDHSHAAWSALLKKHVVLISKGRASQLDYAGMAKDHAALEAYLKVLSGVPQAEFARWSKAQRMAFLINAYNAFTIEKILTRYPDIGSIWDFGKIFGNPFKDEFFSLFGRPFTLDGIEHGMLRKPGAYDEPRVHFAVNCAASGSRRSAFWRTARATATTRRRASSRSPRSSTGSRRTGGAAIAASRAGHRQSPRARPTSDVTRRCSPTRPRTRPAFAKASCR